MNRDRIGRRQTKIRKNIVLIAAVSAGVLVAPAVAAGAEENASPALSDTTIDSTIARSAAKQKGLPIAVRGHVTKDGIPREGASIVARIWPSTEELARVPEGEPAGVKIVAFAKSDSEGSFEIPLALEAVPDGYTEPDGSIAMQIYVLDAGRELPWNMSVRSVDDEGEAPGRWTTSAQLTSKNEDVPTLKIDVGRQSSVLQTDDPASDWVAGDGQLLADTQGASAIQLQGDATVVPMAVEHCWGADPAGGTLYSNRREKFMNVYGWTGAKVTVHQRVGSSTSHTLGVGFKALGASWTANGTLSQSSTGAGQTVSGLINNAIFNSVNYRLWNCGHPQNPEVIMGQEIRPAGFYDIFNEPLSVTTHQYYSASCVNKSSGTVWKDSGTNQTFATGVSSPFISLSAKSGYDAGTKISFSVKQPSKLCSNNAAGWLSASAVDMRSQ